MTSRALPDGWKAFVDAARVDPYKDAVTGASNLPKWMLKALLGYPVPTALVVGVVAGAFATLDPPVDWLFVVALAAVIACAVLISSLVLRRRVRHAMGTQTNDVSQTRGNVSTEQPAE